jgi:ABC-type metal ion transport system substrate-binding protein
MRLLFATFATALLLLTGCSAPKEDGQTLRVAATAIPHAEILKQAKPLLAKEGVDLQIKVFADSSPLPVCTSSRSVRIRTNSKASISCPTAPA